MNLLNKIDDIEGRWAEYVRSDHPNVTEIIPMLELGLIRKELTRIANHLDTLTRIESARAAKEVVHD